MNLFEPKRFFIVKGNAEGVSHLNSFDGALLDSGIGNANLIKISSIIPPNCKFAKYIQIPAGSFIPVAYASITSDMPGEYVAAGVAAIIPTDKELAGVIMEYSSRGRKKDIESIVRNMAIESMKMRRIFDYKIKSKVVEHKVEHIGTAFAAVVLWQ